MSFKLIGNESSGKSTFLSRFFSDILPTQTLKRCVVVNISFKEYHRGSGDPVAWCIARLMVGLEFNVYSSNPPTYDELLGVYFGEYKRLSEGPMRNLYKSDKDEFKRQFGEFIENQRRQNPADYVELLLKRAVLSNKKLPCVVIDDIEQLSADAQDAVYKLIRALARSSPTLIFLPITGRTAWKIRESGVLNDYSARSYYLPVPEAKEIIEKRIQFLEKKLASAKSSNEYFSRKGFQISTGDIKLLSDAISDVLLGTDYVTRMLFRLGNFEISRTFKIAERIFVSPDIEVDDLIKARFEGRSVASNLSRSLKAIIRGEKDRLDEAENPYITNIFWTDSERPSSPLFLLYLLWAMKQRLHDPADESLESKYWLVSDLIEFFEPCGISAQVLMVSIRRLHRRGLVSTLIPKC